MNDVSLVKSVSGRRGSNPRPSAWKAIFVSFVDVILYH